ncbi:GNAT family N-acetyltransferase [Pseudomonas piscis]|uniref:GNAT family N-acetyltransferase n=1 Tax=Pseudomonas TaxID=286 RepID=UPI000A1E8474|nr:MULTISPECIES: GNAT family N-acetyltransferase [unclassified Pseudomonas]
MISTRSIKANEWPQYRDMRLRALEDSPDAFASTLEDEAARTDEEWAARIAAGLAGGNDLPLFAFKGSQACGLVWCKLPVAESAVADIYQMWVDPACRGLGAGAALLEQVLAWARGKGARRIRLGVTYARTPAMHLYQACGFRPVGALEPLRAGSSLMSQAMELELAAL